MMLSSSLLTKILIGSLVGVLVVGGVVGSRLLFQNKASESVSPVGVTQEVPSTVGSTSGVDERVRNLEASLAEVVEVLKTTTGKTVSTPTQAGSLESRVKSLETGVADLQVRVKALESGTKTTTTTSTSTSTKSPDYLRIGWNNSSTSTEWGSVGSTEISIAGSDYSGYTSMRFEVKLNTSNSSNRGYARLFNKDDNSAVTGSEVSTDATTPTWVYSGNFTLPSNRKTYYLQMKSANGAGAQVSDAQVRVSY